MLLGKYREINTIYFLSIYVFLLFIYLFPFFSKSVPFSVYFFTESVIQSTIEALVFYYFALFLYLFKQKTIFLCYIGCSFVIFLLHLVDFTTSRLLDASFSYVYKFFWGSSTGHIIAAFYALNLSPSSTALYIFLVIFIPLAGIGFYFFTLPFSQKIPTFSKSKILSILIALLFVSVTLNWINTPDRK